MLVPRAIFGGVLLGCTRTRGLLAALQIGAQGSTEPPFSVVRRALIVSA